MANSLHPLFLAFATANDERQLRLRFMDTVGEYFGVQRWGICLLDEQSCPDNFDVQGVPEAVLTRYQEAGQAVDPIMRYVIERHAPVHEQLVLGSGGWEKSEFYRQFSSRDDHKHLMAGPIVGSGRLVGTVHFARGGDTSAFTTQDLADLSAICSHLSACLATLRAKPTQFDSLLASRLTKRELQIAELVARGLTNAEIGAELWIAPNSVKQALKRMFRKLNVSTRTEMVVQLQRNSNW
jgi:DNA-binding CsgD family transcriptional regulator